MKLLKIDFDKIQKAMEDVARDSFDYFLDLYTGEVIALSEDILDAVEVRLYEGDFDEIGDGVEYIEFSEEPTLPFWMEDEVELVLDVMLDKNGRYARIPERYSSEAHRVMSEFLENVEDPVLKGALSHALNRKGAFRRFKDALINYPKERKRWHGYNAKAMKKVIIEWLKSLEVEPAQIYPGKKERGTDYVREVEL
jgi:hypothetical protein